GGLAIDAIGEDDDGEIGWPLVANGRKRTQPHQHFTVTGDHRDAAIRPREREAQSDHGGPAHRAPQIEVARIVPRRGEIPGRRTEPRHNEQTIVAGCDQCSHLGATLEPQLVQTFLPISCCERTIATMRSSPNDCWTARSAMPTTSSGSRTR